MNESMQAAENDAIECRWCPPGCKSCEPDDCECYTHQDEPDKAFATVENGANERCPDDGQTLAWHQHTGRGPDGEPRTNGQFIGCDRGGGAVWLPAGWQYVITPATVDRGASPVEERLAASLTEYGFTEDDVWQALEAVMPLVRAYGLTEYQRGIEAGQVFMSRSVADRLGLSIPPTPTVEHQALNNCVGNMHPGPLSACTVSGCGDRG